MPARSNLGAKDYELIAATIAECKDLDDDQRFFLALDFAERLVATSDSFDPVRFVNSCGIIEDVSAKLIAGRSHALRLRVTAQEARRSNR